MNSLVNLYEFSTGRILFALKGVEQRLKAGGGVLVEPAAEARRALEVVRGVRALEARWKGSRGATLHGGVAQRLRAELIRVLGALDSALGSALRAWGPDDPLGEAATATQERLFPRGVAHLTQISYVEQAEEVTELLERVDAEADLAEALRELGVAKYVERLRKVHARFVVALQPGDAPSWDEVREAQKAAHGHLCAVVCRVAGLWHAADLESEEGQALDAAMQVVWEQNRAIRISYQRNRGVRDVDPETGDEVEGDSGEVELKPTIAVPFALPDFESRAEDVA